ncbi:hypothetical protein TRICI_002072 [Trichomonascus ciferrii]|uniref:Uncharacterized protein n=1 Tax=Trichomonascus ciferrii TaxID=44093 RepID=A0A642V6R3_9ASCO|nr:hypothetical protein TRICI_002072 [Trichomonascus ciferrii]
MSLSKPAPGPTLLQSTKSLTTASLNAISELAASILAGEKDPKTGSYFSSRIIKMALYGFFISAPLSHYLIMALQRAFRGKSGVFWKIAQIVASNLTVAPIQASCFILFMAFIAGARSTAQFVSSYKAGIWPVLRANWCVSPVSLAVAQAFLPEHTWVPFFSVITFFLGTYNNMIVKKKRQQKLREEAADDEKKDI